MFQIEFCIEFVIIGFLNPPGSIPAPPAVIPAVKKTYAEAATMPYLERATHVYVQHRKGLGPPLTDNYVGPNLALEKGPKVFKLHKAQAPSVAAQPPCWGRSHKFGTTYVECVAFYFSKSIHPTV